MHWFAWGCDWWPYSAWMLKVTHLPLSEITSLNCQSCIISSLNRLECKYVARLHSLSFLDNGIMNRSKDGDTGAQGTSLRHNWVSRIKAKVKRGQSSTPETATSLLTPPVLAGPALSGSSATSMLSDDANQTDAEPLQPNSTTASEPNISIGNRRGDKTESLWVKAYDAAASDTRKWIESILDLDMSPDSNKSDRMWTEELVEMVKAMEKKHEDKAFRIIVGQKEINVRDYAAPAVAWLTTIGDIAIQFAPPPSGIIWPAIKILLQVCCISISHRRSRALLTDESFQ